MSVHLDICGMCWEKKTSQICESAADELESLRLDGSQLFRLFDGDLHYIMHGVLMLCLIFVYVIKLSH